MRIIGCPKGQWLDLVEHMQNEEIFNGLKEEMDVLDFERWMDRNTPTLTMSGRENTIQFLVAENMNDRRIISEIENRYGETYTRACETLRQHVNSCPGCKNEYLMALDSYSESTGKYQDNARALGVTETKDYLDCISAYDFLKVIKSGK